MAEPVSIDEARKHLRVDGTADDVLIAEKIAAAREWVEDYTGLLLTRREVTERIGSLSARTELRAWPVAEAAPLVITYRDRSGTEQTISDAALRTGTRPALIYPAAGSYWPSAAASGIEVTFTAGFAAPEDIPAKLKQAVLVMLTGFYEDREGGALFVAAEQAARRLCRAQRGRML